MQSICGFFHIDGRPAEPVRLDAMRRSLPGQSSRNDWGALSGSAASAGVWSSPTPGAVAEQAGFIDRETGCIVVADALLVEPETVLGALGKTFKHDAQISDVETIACAWLRWGDECLARLDGDFAFAVYDPRRQRLFLARDGMGVRPLYIHHAPGRLLAFASTAAGVLAHGEVPTDLDEGRIADFLISQLEGIDQTSTFYAAIERLPPGHSLCIDTGSCTRRRYWFPGNDPSPSLPQSDGEWEEAVRAALNDAVRSRMRGAANIGSMVSGGMDSSAVSAIAAQLLAGDGEGPLPTFSAIDTTNPDCPETRAIRAMLKNTGFAPTLIDRAQIDAWPDALKRSMATSSEPFDSQMTLIAAQYYFAAACGVDAVLDGIDADSLFSEGDHMARLLRSGRWPSAWREARGLEQVYGKEFPAAKQLLMVAPGAFVPQALRKCVRFLRRGSMLRGNVGASLIEPGFARRCGLADRLQRNADVRVRIAAQGHEGIATMANPSLTAGIERYHRVAAMHGIEPRHPFLDRRLIALCLLLPDAQRVRDGWNKRVFRNAMRPLLPESVLQRRSKESLGFGFTAALFARDRDERIAAVEADFELLAPFVNRGRLDGLIHDLHSGDQEAIELVIEASQLLDWLRMHRDTLRQSLDRTNAHRQA